MSDKFLQLSQEHKIYELLADHLETRYEASGVYAQGDYFYVIFDSLPHIARFHASLTVGHADNKLIESVHDAEGYEDIAYHATAEQFHLLIESVKHSKGTYKARIETYNKEFGFIEGNWVEIPFETTNKGLEGLAYIRHMEQDYLLALCESNKCKAGKAGRKPGGGRIHILQKSGEVWNSVGKIKLPKSVLFEDYASLAIDDQRRVAVVSQATSALWVGQLQADSWTWVDEGQTYRFSLDEKGKPAYCNVEGVSWFTPTQIVVVSDKRKSGEQPKSCGQKDQSIHIFNLPVN